MTFIVYIFLIAGFTFFFMGLFPKDPETVSVFGDEVKDKKGSVFSPILSPFAPFNKIFLSLFRLEKPLNHKMYLSRWKISAAEFLVVKELLCICVVLFSYLVGIRNLWLFLIGVLVFFIPDIVLNSRVKKRKFLIVRVLPETIDLLGLCVGAGLDFMAAVRWVVDKVEMNPMIEEMTHVLKEINVGKPRAQALRDMSKRIDIPDVTSFVRILIQADRMGTPVEETFKILSEDTRMRRFHRGERQAMTAPIKMLVPLVFCILPVILIIVAGPIIIRFMKQGFFEGVGLQ
jgi:pilus assembly protein TadC